MAPEENDPPGWVFVAARVLDTHAMAQLASSVDRLRASGRDRVVVDLSGVVDIDTRAVVLLSELGEHHARPRRVILTGLNERLKFVVRSTMLDAFFDVRDDVSALGSEPPDAEKK